MAALIPTGTAKNKDSTVINNVLISAGSKDTFFDVYFISNNSGVKFGIPFIRIYAIIKNSANIVIHAARHTEKNNKSDFGSCL